MPERSFDTDAVFDDKAGADFQFDRQADFDKDRPAEVARLRHTFHGIRPFSQRRERMESGLGAGRV